MSPEVKMLSKKIEISVIIPAYDEEENVNLDLKKIRPIVTNASLSTEEKILELKQMGLSALQSSIYSINPEEHNNLRGLKDNFPQPFKKYSA
ncbi:MAG: hypothetical protein ACETWM_03705 [Candidatus Lokiarchaeia archaeon]